MFPLFKNKRTTGGLLRHLGLADWWNNNLEEPERQRILKRYQPLGGSSESLVEGDILSTSQSPLHLLWGLATWLKGPADYVIATKIFKKGEELVPHADVLDSHFFYQAQIKVFYQNRDEVPEALNLAILACESQIAISGAAASAFQKRQGDELPLHKGFKQLAIILEKKSQLEEAIRVCLRAQTEGWSGDWEPRLARLSKRAERKMN